MLERSFSLFSCLCFTLLPLLSACELERAPDGVSFAQGTDETEAASGREPYVAVEPGSAGGGAFEPPASDGHAGSSAPDAGPAGTPSDAPPPARAGAGAQDEKEVTVDAPIAKTLRVDGQRILDTCGKPWMARGVEQVAGIPFASDGTLAGLAAELVKTGSNAVRLVGQGSAPAEIDTLLSALEAQKVVVYLSPGDRAWFRRRDVREVLLRHEKGLILDAFRGAAYDDVPRWLDESKAAVSELRAAGYTAPFAVLANNYGRDLSAVLEHGQEVFDADPLRNTILTWHAYWGGSGWYQRESGMSLTEGVDKCAEQAFPIQLGILLYADPADPMDYSEVMAAAQRRGLGWLWWSFWNRWDDTGNNASIDGTALRLTPAGQAVLHSDPSSIERTANKACFR